MVQGFLTPVRRKPQMPLVIWATSRENISQQVHKWVEACLHWLTSPQYDCVYTGCYRETLGRVNATKRKIIIYDIFLLLSTPLCHLRVYFYIANRSASWHGTRRDDPKRPRSKSGAVATCQVPVEFHRRLSRDKKRFILRSLSSCCTIFPNTPGTVAGFLQWAALTSWLLNKGGTKTFTYASVL